MDISKGRYWDKPLSLIDGCTPCSPGCDHCWSAAMMWRFCKNGKEYSTVTKRAGNFAPKFTGKVIIHPDRLDIPLKRRKPTVWAIWNDLFHELVADDFQYRALEIMASQECQHHTFLILTKRPRIAFKLIQEHIDFKITDNIYFGLTICNQPEADAKLPEFLKVPGKKFLSIEPMLSEIKIKGLSRCGSSGGSVPQIDAVILGGETLGNRPGREMKLEWAEGIVNQCTSAGVPVFVKQIHLNGKISKDISEWPSGLQRRELPWLQKDRPEFLNLGADSKGHGLPEPTVSKIHALVDKLKEYGIELREKHNLKRLKP